MMKPQELLDFSGQVVIVTGAGGNIGAGIAIRFAEAGADIVVHYRSSEAGAKSVLAEIESMGRRGLAIKADVTQKADVEKLFSETIKTFGKVNVLVNNAGIYPTHSIIEMDDSDWDAVINANLRSAFLCTQSAANHMKDNDEAIKAIINIASIEAENPAPMHSHYNAAKAGTVMLSRSSALELGVYGIRVNTVSPGLIWREGIEEAWADGVQRYTSSAPLGRLGMPEDVANACLFLASPAASWISGVNLVVDGGVLTTQIF